MMSLIALTASYTLLLFTVACCARAGGDTQNNVAAEEGACSAHGDCKEDNEQMKVEARPIRTSVWRPFPNQANFLDFVFILECPCSSESSTSTLLTEVLSSWVKMTSEGDSSHKTRMALVLYSSFSSEEVFAKDLTKLSSAITATVIEQCNKVCSSTSHHPASNEGYMISLRKTLQFILGILSEGSINTSGGPTQRLSLRSHADLHLVSFTGFSDTGGGKSQASEEKKLNDLISQVIDASTSQHIAFHFFVKTSNKAASLIGSAEHAIKYKDCTHFNKALTLSLLIAAGENHANSLQAHLLSKGILAEVSDLSDLSNLDCVRNINPSLWSDYRLHDALLNRCQVNWQCPKGKVCFPLHGCLENDIVQNFTTVGEDKVPLPTHISTSHVDLISSSFVSSGPLQAEPLSIIEQSSTRTPFSLSDTVTGSPKLIHISPEQPFAQEAIAGGSPVLIQGSVVTSWSASEKWTLPYIQQKLNMSTIPLVKCTNSSLTFDPDKRVPLKMNLLLPYTLVNMSKDDFFTCVQEDGPCSRDGYSGHYFFGGVPDDLKPDLLPDNLLYNTDKDYSAKRQFIWISSKGMITHGHFDQDFNFFVQLVGKKRFTLWAPSQHELLYVFPRIHPLWHKSRINFNDPDLIKFPLFAHSRAVQVTVEPGDVLYIPPYTWHYVETLTPSVSLSTWSHDYHLYDHMRAIYRHDHKFDLISDPRGQMFALRLYLDMLVHDLYGYNETTQFFTRLLKTRFEGLEHLFPPSHNEESICQAAVAGKIPTCNHIHGYVKLDVLVVGGHLKALPPEVMGVLFLDYVEEITAQVVGVKRMLAFFRYCFVGQEYYITELGKKEHNLWDHSESHDSEDNF